MIGKVILRKVKDSLLIGKIILRTGKVVLLITKSILLIRKIILLIRKMSNIATYSVNKVAKNLITLLIYVSAVIQNLPFEN